MTTASTRPFSCPSAQPGMRDLQVLGIVDAAREGPRLAYLNAHVAATPELLGEAGPVPVTSVFRLTAKCEEHRCVHYDGKECQLATRIVGMLSPVTDSLPPCVIRRSCRWYAQEGAAACVRCPQVVTSPSDGDLALQRVAVVRASASGAAPAERHLLIEQSRD